MRERDSVFESVGLLSAMRASGADHCRGTDRLDEGRKTDRNRDSRLLDAAGLDE